MLLHRTCMFLRGHNRTDETKRWGLHRICVCLHTCYRIDKLRLHWLCMCLHTCCRTDNTKRCVYIHVIWLIRWRDDSYIGYVCVYVHVIGLTRQRDEGWHRMCICLHTCCRTDKTKRWGVTLDVYLSTYNVIGLTRQRDEGYIGCVLFVYANVVGLTSYGYIGCMCIFTCFKADKTKR